LSTGAEWVTAGATFVLAVTAAIAIVANIRLVRATERAVDAANKTAKSAEEEALATRRSAEAMEKSVAMQADQAAFARDAAAALLRGEWPGQVRSGFNGEVQYVGGTEPAHDVRVLVRVQDRYWHARCDDLLPMAPRAPYDAAYCDKRDVDDMPVPDEFKAASPDRDALMIAWRGADGRSHWWARAHEFRPKTVVQSGQEKEIPLWRPSGPETRGLWAR
jgi:hypothetical protein